MKIDNSIRAVTSAAVSESQGRATKAPPRPSGGTADNVQLSALSERLQAIEAGLADVPVVDTAKVAEIKQAIAEGRFKVNADRVADRLLDTVRDLIASRRD
jgi:negative regulator of flagellin synthesis FlgM